MENKKMPDEIIYETTLQNGYALRLSREWIGNKEKILLTKNGELLAELSRNDAIDIFNFGLFLLKQRTE